MGGRANMGLVVFTLAVSACGVPPVSVVINEVTSSSDDTIELYNASAKDVDLSGWSLTDANPDGAGHRFTLLAGSTLPAHGFWPLTKGDHQSFSFGLGDDDAVHLYDASGLLIDEADYPLGQARVSWCRVPDGVGLFRACSAATLGRANTE